MSRGSRSLFLALAPLAFLAVFFVWPVTELIVRGLTDERSDVAEVLRSDALRSEVASGWRRARERDAIFGVPSFVYAGKLYWGQDRMHFLRSAVLRKS